ncbi:mitochondrial potassium channel isoform X2 [Sphaeramia orbicularis]|nr:coiled-coil domain-containing protein 51 isoform X2 [Sphaeramia orbicularis]
MCVWPHGVSLSGSLSRRIALVRMYSAHQQPSNPPSVDPTPPEGKSSADVVKERALVTLQNVGDLGRRWGQKSAQMASSTVNYWWERYEEFVGLNDVREAQTKVTEAEAAFMVARGMVREAHSSLEVLQGRLKEIRDRLDRVSREEARYLELATQEHKLLQEERRLRTAYENAEGSEREKFSLFSTAVRESHEKERSRAERTKNWSIIGSVLGALIGVMGSTYVNRVRLQELKNLLLEAQKGPESLQEALRVQAGDHRTQQNELRMLIHSLKVTLKDAVTPRDPAGPPAPTPAPTEPLSALKELHDSNQRVESVLDSLPPKLDQLEQGLVRLVGDTSAMKMLMETRTQTDLDTQTRPLQQTMPMGSEGILRSLEETKRTLGDRIRTNALYNTVITSTATAVTVGTLYLLLRGTT